MIPNKKPPITERQIVLYSYYIIRIAFYKEDR